MKRRTYLASFFTLLFGGGVVVFGATTFLGGVVSAESFQSQEDVTFTFVPTVNISISGDLIITDLATSSTSDSNQITVTTSSNNAIGYTLGSTVGNSSNASTELRKDGTSTTTIFSSITSNKTTLANFSDSNWGYSYSTDSGTTWRSGDITGTTQLGYNGLPVYTTSSPVKIINSNTNGSNSVKFKIGAKSSSSQTPGTYTNTINFIGVPKVIATTYTISYNDPSGEATNMPTQQGGTDTTGYGAINISSTQPARSNYLFKGWCTAQTTDDTCSGDTIKPGHLLALNPGTSSMTPSVTKTLYAMWGSNTIPAPGECTDTATCMQTLASCPTTATTVTDARDGEQYLIQQLADGKCWMLENLRLGSTSTIQLDSSNTNLPSGTTFTLPTSTTTGFSNDATGYTQAAINIDSKDNNTYHWGSGSGKVGTYYNFCAASAGTYCYTSGSGTTDDIQFDICPAGWHIPTAGNYGDYGSLWTSGGNSVANFQTNLSANLSGTFYDGSVHDQSSPGSYYSYKGEFWTSSPIGSDSIYNLLVSFDTVSFNTLSERRYKGLSVRCVMKSPSMQNVDASTLASMLPNVGDTTTLRDARDDQEYTVAKLADGKYWMTSNLNLAGGTALSADDTDVSSSYISSFSTSSGLTKNGNTIVLPASSQSGFDYEDYSYVYNSSSTDCSSSTGCYGYYSWDAATLGSGRSISTNNTDAPYSICPKGWRLPTSRTTSATNWQTTSDFYAMAHHYGLDSTTSTEEEDSDFYNQAGPGTIPNFLLAGAYYSGSFEDGGSYGCYWSATSDSDTSYARSLDFSSSDVGSAYKYDRSSGQSLRCLLSS